MLKDVPAHEPLCYIPSKCMITTEHARMSPIGHLLENHEALFVSNWDRDNNIILVYIMYERLQGSESFYHPFFEMVDSLTPTVYWEDAVIAQSDLTFFKERIRDGKKHSEEQW